ncbi:MAG: hypothetical protein EOP84_14000 [Verrucomicrobiaceae bacterium]|nr:MAG: hypothetical protein EOP84_14000 [Verrucomicrobiaceae bacterium]
MTIESEFEPRLQRRYEQLICEHLRVAEQAASGVRHVSAGQKEIVAAAQGAWRFYANESVELPQLANPLLEHARKVLKEEGAKVILCVEDWSKLTFSLHRAKQERTKVGKRHDLGYELQVSLLISERDGQPIAPVVEQLRSESGIYSTRSTKRLETQCHLDELTERMSWMEAQNLGAPIVHIIDREGSSVGHMRQWVAQERRFLVRATDRVVRWRQENWHLRDLAEKVRSEGRKHRWRKGEKIRLSGKTLRQRIWETSVVLDRPAQSERKGLPRRRVPGAPITLRLVITQLRDEKAQVHAQWWLLSNVPKKDANLVTLARWYYWRWKIENFFKLLKSAGQQVQHWLQRTPEAFARRLLVASMACVLVWNLARDPSEEARQLRQTLANWSGRKLKHGQEFTETALLEGVFLLLASLKILHSHSLEELQAWAASLLPISYMQKQKLV